MSKGFFEGILQDILLAGAVEASRNNNGKPDPYKAAGIAMGFGQSSLEDQMRLATMLGAEGAFDDSEFEHDLSGNGSNSQYAAIIRHDWRDTDIGDEYDILPEDYDSEDEFIAAVEEAEALALSGVGSFFTEEPSANQFVDVSKDEDSQTEERKVRKYLYEKYSEMFPNAFTKDYLNQTFFDIGSRASKKASSVEAPYLMVFDLTSHCNVEGLGIFYLLLDGYSKKCLEACSKHLPEIISIIEKLNYDDLDLEAILAFVQGKVVLNLHDISAAYKILNIIIQKYPERIHDERIKAFCLETVDLLTDGSIKSSFDSKIRFLAICSKAVEDLKTKKCYKKAMERTYAENEAQQLVYRFRPTDTKALQYWDVGDDFMDEFVYDMLTSKDSNIVCPTFALLGNDQSLTARQKMWVSQGFDHLLQYAADGCGEDEVYTHYASDSIFKKMLLGSSKYLGEILGHLLAMTISKHDLIIHRDLIMQYDKFIRFTDRKGAFVKSLNEALECAYIDPFCDSAEKFADYISMANNLKTVTSDPAAKVNGSNIKRLCDDIDSAYSSYIEKYKKRSLAEDRYNELLKKILSLLNKIDDGIVWKSKSISKGSLKFVFKFPDGKNGDINMYLASKCGEVVQEDAITRSVRIGMKNRDYFPLLAHQYGDDGSLNDGLYQYLHKEHNFYLALDAISEIENYQSVVLRETDVELKMPQDVWQRIQSTEQKFYTELTNQRNEIYQALAKAGLLSAKWVSEYQVFSIANSLYPDAIYQYHAEWLGQQSLDIFIPSISVGIEYQGAQHYQAIEIFGGEEGLRERKKLDARKKRLCRENGIRLVEIKHTDEITIDLVKKRIQSVL